MSTRTWTLDEIRAALIKTPWPSMTAKQWEAFQAALLVAKPEAKTCNHGCLPGCRFKNCCTPSCWPAPAASPPVSRFPGQPPFDQAPDRAKAVPQDAATQRPPACNATYPEVDCLIRIGGRCNHEACYRHDAKRNAMAEKAHGNCVAGTCCRCGGSEGTSPFDGHNFCSSFCANRAKAQREKAQDSPRKPCDPSCYDPVDGWCSALCVPPPIEPSGGQPGVPDEPECYLCQAKPANYADSDGKLYCRPCARGGRRDIGVPAEPSRPVTGEAALHDMMCFCIACAPNQRCEPGPVILAITPPASGNRPGRPDAWDERQERWREQCESEAPGNHPGTPACECELGYVCRKCAGKPDEAPLACDNEPMGPDSFGGTDEGSHLDNRAHVALRETRETLASATSAGMEVAALAGRLGDEMRDLRAQLATRDARIAGLEASSADLVKRCQEAEAIAAKAAEELADLRDAEDDKAAAVLAERKRCLAWWNWCWMHDGTPQQRSVDTVVGLEGGAPAPTGAK